MNWFAQRTPRWCAGLLLTALAPVIAPAQEAAEFFRQNCVSCHTVGGGRLTGPDLKDVGQRKDRSWLTKFLLNPQAAINSGDAYALQLQQQARGVVMPTVQGMNKGRAEALLDLIDAESKLDKSQFMGLQISDRPFTQDDFEQGRRMFLGTRRLLNGGPPCISCHTMKDLGGLGGGRLGPDLTRVFERLEGRKNLASWLFAPATPTMQPVFRKHPLDANEALLLVALFEDSAKRGGQDDSVAVLNFFFLALGGTVIGLVAFDGVWKRRFRAVRRPLAAGKEMAR